jgi:hypothetical protein
MKKMAMAPARPLAHQRTKMENDGEENGGYSIRRGRGVRKTSNHFRVLILTVRVAMAN